MIIDRDPGDESERADRVVFPVSDRVLALRRPHVDREHSARVLRELARIDQAERDLAAEFERARQATRQSDHDGPVVRALRPAPPAHLHAFRL